MGSLYDNICFLIKKLDINDDSIIMDRKIRALTEDFESVVLNDDHMLQESFQYFNDVALDDSNFAMNFALFFSSRTFDSLVTNGSKVRAEMLNILQQNFMNADKFKQKDRQQFYNSITLLGEYYNRSRIAEQPVRILGESLLDLLTKQLQDEIANCQRDSHYVIDLQFTRLILTQITLNGPLARPKHKNEIEALLYEVRRCLIEIPTLSVNIKAIFLMTLDLYNNNFTSVGQDLEKLYAKYLQDTDKLMEKPLVRNADGNSSEAAASTSSANTQSPAVPNLKVIKSDLTNPARRHITSRINNEYIGRPLKASERLKYAQKQQHMQKNRHEELEQEKLFEKNVEDKRAAEESLKQKVIEENEMLNSQHESEMLKNIDEDAVSPSPSNTSTMDRPRRSPRERKEEQAYFLVKPLNARQRLKIAQTPQISEPTDWYEEVQEHENNLLKNSIATATTTTTGLQPNKLDSSKKQPGTAYQNGYNSSYSSQTTSPVEMKRHNFRNTSFRSNKSDCSSTYSMDRKPTAPRFNNNYNNSQNQRNNYHNSNGRGGNYRNRDYYQGGGGSVVDVSERQSRPNVQVYHRRQYNNSRDRQQNYNNYNHTRKAESVGSGVNLSNYASSQPPPRPLSRQSMESEPIKRYNNSKSDMYNHNYSHNQNNNNNNRGSGRYHGKKDNYGGGSGGGGGGNRRHSVQYYRQNTPQPQQQPQNNKQHQPSRLNEEIDWNDLNDSNEYSSLQNF